MNKQPLRSLMSPKDLEIGALYQIKVESIEIAKTPVYKLNLVNIPLIYLGKLSSKEYVIKHDYIYRFFSINGRHFSLNKMLVEALSKL